MKADIRGGKKNEGEEEKKKFCAQARRECTMYIDADIDDQIPRLLNRSIINIL